MSELDRAEELARSGDSDAAVTAFRAIVDSSDPAAAPWASARLGELLARVGEHDAARPHLTYALGSADGRAAALAALLLGSEHGNAGDLDAARDLFQRAIDSAADQSTRTYAMRNMGALLDSEGNRSGARAQWEAATAAGYRRPEELRLRIAHSFWDDGDFSASRNALLQVARSADHAFATQAIFSLNRLTDFSAATGAPRAAPHRVRFRVEFDPCAAVWQTGDSGAARDAGPQRPPSVYLGAVRPGHGNNPPRDAWRMVTGDTEHAVLVLGPPRAGKTAGIIVPNVLAWRGPVVSTSVKTEVAEATLAARARFGACWHFDPSGSTPLGATISPMRGLEIPAPKVRALRWSPIASCRDWGEANRVAFAMVGAGISGEDKREPFWTERATALLGPLLHAAARADPRLRMRDVARWVRQANLQDALDILTAAADDGDLGADIAADTLRGLAGARELATHWSSVDGVLRAYRDPHALETADEPNFDLQRFCRSTDTVYVTSPGVDQSAMAPIIVGFLRALSYELFSARLRHDEPSMLWALDEMSNIAPIPDLSDLLSVAGSQHLLIIGAIQDLSQARQRWGQAADGFLTLFHTKLVLSGVADTDTLHRLSQLAGDEEVVKTSTTASAQFGASKMSTTERVPNLPEDRLANPGPGIAWRFAGAQWNEADGQVWIPPYYSTSPWCDMAVGPERHAACLRAAWSIAEAASRELLGFLAEWSTGSGLPARLAVAAYLAIVAQRTTAADYARACGLTVEQAIADFYAQFSADRGVRTIAAEADRPAKKGFLGRLAALATQPPSNSPGSGYGGRPSLLDPDELAARLVVPLPEVRFFEAVPAPFTHHTWPPAPAWFGPDAPVAPAVPEISGDTPLTWSEDLYYAATMRYHLRGRDFAEAARDARWSAADLSGFSDDRESHIVIPIVQGAAQQPGPAAELAQLGPLAQLAERHAALMLGADTMFADPASVWPPRLTTAAALEGR